MKPAPENVTGERIEKHVFTHQIQWGYVALGVAALAALYLLSGWFGSSSSAPQELTQGRTEEGLTAN